MSLNKSFGAGPALLKRLRRLAALAALPFTLLASSPAAHAVDGCAVLLCMSGAWKKAPQAETCEPPVYAALRAVARGHSWPHCAQGGGYDSGAVAATEETCPPFYSNYSSESGRWMSCQYPTVVRVTAPSGWFSDVFSDADGNTSTHYSDTARLQLGASIDPKYDQDAAAWAAAHPPHDPPPDDGCVWFNGRCIER